ncbi:MAG: NAD(P)H-dependent oxidoreductase, partial [Burkholderiales bacterium]|nr:NAD(P)H-dependent oxidoreductase [Burkholderiales bacterium]
MPRILVLVAHPQIEHSRISRRLMQAARTLAAARPDIAVRDLYALYPDYLIDVAAEQAALAEIDLLVWLHPTQWYSMPSMMKLWLDEVLAFGWAYGPGGNALRGRDLWLVTSTGGPEESYRADGYNRYEFKAFMAPYDQTAALTGMRFLPPLVLHGAHRASDEALQTHAEAFSRWLAHYPDCAGL